VAAQDDGVLGQAQRLARGDAQLLLDEVEAGDELRHRVLDLEPGVHLEEEVLGRPVGGDDELDGAGADVTAGERRPDGRGAHRLALRRRQQRGRRLLDHLLVPPLEAALALAEVDAAAVAVGEHLDLDVPRAPDVPLEQQLAVPERGHGLAAGRGDGGRELARRVDAAHALAAAARGRLEQHREPDPLGRGREVVVGHPAAVLARDDRDAGRGDERLRGDLVAHRADRVRWRADPDQPGVLHGPREVRVLGEEAVPGVDGVGADRARRGDQRGRVEVAAGGVRPGQRPDADGDVGLADVARAGVRVAVDRGGADAQPPQRAHDPDGDLAAVGDEDGPEERHGVTSGTCRRTPARAARWRRRRAPGPARRGSGAGR
jgi:hypothetical protein